MQYERNLTGSYMKMDACEDENFDECILLKGKLPGLLEVEKCYFDGVAQYQYQISGKQSLDNYCAIEVVGIEFIEKVIVSICSQIKILENHLLAPNGLLLQQEYIFIDHASKEIRFTYYPGESNSLSQQLQMLMEYLLTKIDHTDAEAVRMSYELYEKTLDEGYSIWNIQESIIQSRQKKEIDVSEPIEKGDIAKEEPKEKRTEKKKDTTALQEHSTQSPLYQKLLEFIENEELYEWKICLEKADRFIKSILNKKKNASKINRKSEEKELVIYPDEPEEALDELHPTICLTDFRKQPDGRLLYEGYENFSDIKLEKREQIIGKGVGADIRIEKETISHVHAKLIYENDDYYLEDLNSTNGCTINGNILNYHERYKLSGNDIICFADVKYRFI